MKNLRSTCAAAVCGAILLGVANLPAAEVKTYPATGSVIELTPTSITIQRGDTTWEVARSKNTQVTGKLKVGATVTVQYRMVAAEVEVKAGKGKK
ncbi:MAG: hypothetical protein WCL11_16385 [Verrucomicrobiota bacterium]|nr:hypothetical protein [Verrucomicrobiota bacterium]